MIKTCLGCQARFEKMTDDPALHLYIGAIAECWEMFSEILAKEYTDPAYFEVHGMTVDAYCAQHIGDQTDRRARQSANVHLIGLDLALSDKNRGLSRADFLKKATEVKLDWPSLTQRVSPHWLTVQDIQKAHDSETHAKLVTEWGRSVWEAYSDCHDDLRALAARLT